MTNSFDLGLADLALNLSNSCSALMPRSLLDIITDICSILGNIAICAISFYPLYIYHWSKKIKIYNYYYSVSAFFGSNLNVFISNRTLSPKTIKKIYIITENRYKFLLKDFEEPFVLEPFKMYEIKGDKVSNDIPNCITSSDNVYFLVEVDGKTKQIPFRGKAKKFNPKNSWREFEPISRDVFKVDDEIISRNVKYILTYWINDKRHIVYITASGFMNRCIIGKNWNQLPAEVLINSSKLESFFEHELADIKHHLVIIDHTRK